VAGDWHRVGSRSRLPRPGAGSLVFILPSGIEVVFPLENLEEAPLDAVQPVSGGGQREDAVEQLVLAMVSNPLRQVVGLSHVHHNPTAHQEGGAWSTSRLVELQQSITVWHQDCGNGRIVRVGREGKRTRIVGQHLSL